MYPLAIAARKNPSTPPPRALAHLLPPLLKMTTALFVGCREGLAKPHHTPHRTVLPK